MHEMSIAESLKEQIDIALRDRPGAIVREIELDIGAIQQVVPEALDIAWESLTADTPLEGSVLKMKEISIVAICRYCGTHYSPEVEDFSCPQCRKADPEFLQGRDILLRAIHCDVEKDADDDAED